MSYTTLSVVAPNATSYDEDYPTRSTENYSHALHEILQDMEDAAGAWYFFDGTVDSATRDAYLQRIHAMTEDVFDYAEGAIDTYRDGALELAAPAWNTIVAPNIGVLHPKLQEQMFKHYDGCMKVCFFIYYMWKTEEDPLLIKEKLQELLIAWPLLDTTIELSSELGQQFKIYPSWKNADLDL
jgi:hypothetical protein